MTTPLDDAPVREVQKEFLNLYGTDYIEFYVGNAKQAAHFYKTAFGFQGIAYAGPETGVKDRASYVVRQNKITFVFTSALRPDHEIAYHVVKHGDGVKAIALLVNDASSAWLETKLRGAESHMAPRYMTDDKGKLGISGIKLYGETVHLFIERHDYNGVFMPGYRSWVSDYQPAPMGLLHVDHCVANVGWNRMNHWVRFYETVMGFKNILSFDDADISTEYSALMSKVMSNGNGYVKFPINEPAEGKKKSQVEEYLEFYGDEGVQHVALATKDIVKTVKDLMARGVEFLKVPSSYYDTLEERVGKIEEDIEPLKELGILVDKDDEGYLLQLFSKPVQDRPTLFFEIIQRKGAQSFGKGNFKALFEAIKRKRTGKKGKSMKLVSYLNGGREQAGLLLFDEIFSLSSLHPSLPKTMGDLLENWEYFMRVAGQAELELKINPELQRAGIPVKAVELLAPVPHPTSLRDGYAFRQHVETARRNRGLEMIAAFDEFPVFYFGNHRSVFGPGVIQCMPDQMEQLDYELEVAILVCKAGRNIRAADADDFIGGLMIMNDFSARQLQMEEMQLSLGPAKGKDFATTMGPWLVTTDELEPFLCPPASGHTGKNWDLTMLARVDDGLLSVGRLSDMHWTFAELIERASYGVDLYPGDIIGSGTVGTGCFLELNGTGKLKNPDYEAAWLLPGEVVELEVEGLGVLRNQIEREEDNFSILALKKTMG